MPAVERDPLLHRPEECRDCLEPRDDPIWLSPIDRVVTRMQMHNHLLVDFAYIQQRRTPDGRWLDVVTFDLRHDEAHVHWHDADGNPVRENLHHAHRDSARRRGRMRPGG
jgi:hypothetical protein